MDIFSMSQLPKPHDYVRILASFFRGMSVSSFCGCGKVHENMTYVHFLKGPNQKGNLKI